MKEAVELFFFPALGMGHLLSAVEIAELGKATKVHDTLRGRVDPHRFTKPTPFMIPIDPYKPRVRECVQETIRTVRLGRFIIEMFSTAMIDVANEFGVPTYVFYTSGAAAGLRGCERDLNIPNYANPFPPKLTPSALLEEHGFTMFLTISKLISGTKGVIVN
nr:anthocyanidin 3-O-glucosyltransferase 2-like [Ipomoea batatas]